MRVSHVTLPLNVKTIKLKRALLVAIIAEESYAQEK